MKRLTILTKPAGYCMEKGKYDGHVAVTRSLVEGLQKIDFNDFNYGANEEKDVAEQVHVLCNVSALKYAIELKKNGRIKILTAGPNIVPFPFEEEAIVTNPMIDKYLVPSDWIKRVYVQMAPNFEEGKNIFSWPAGVDTDFFCPDPGADRDNTVIVYHKSESDQFCYKISYLLRKYGFLPIVFEYGGKSCEFLEKMGRSGKEKTRYSHEDFRRALNKACFSVVISNVETQGIALAEMWSMDVPTICYDPHYYRWEEEGALMISVVALIYQKKQE